MKLIKDLIEDRIVYYWRTEDVRVSPLLPSFELAAEWYVSFHHSSYIGEERRSSIIDRRKLHQHRERLTNTNVLPTDPTGRRLTDRHIKVDEDLSKEKMAKMIEVIAKIDEVK